MAAFWLTYKPYGPSALKGWPIESLQALVKRFEIDPESATEWWRFQSVRAGKVGDRVYLFKQKPEPRGIFGVGTIVGGPERRDSGTDSEGVQPRALVKFDALVDPTKTFLLSLDQISDIVPETTIEAQASGNGVSNEIAAELDLRLAHFLGGFRPPPLGSDESDDQSFDPDSVTDTRARQFRAIRVRRGQAAFRDALLAAYRGRCAVTRCAIPDVLEAAHITPHLGTSTNHPTNGLLLRTDIHTLFDCELLTIDPDSRRVVVADALKQSSYGKLAGQPIEKCADPRMTPNRKALRHHFDRFKSQQQNLNLPK